MKGLLLFMGACAVATAFIPREMRAMNTEEEQASTTTVSTSSTTAAPAKTDVIFCHSKTPCRWITYNVNTRFHESNITNAYCICSPNQTCMPLLEDENTHVFTHYCRDPSVVPISME